MLASFVRGMKLQADRVYLQGLGARCWRPGHKASGRAVVKPLQDKTRKRARVPRKRLVTSLMISGSCH